MPRVPVIHVGKGGAIWRGRDSCPFIVYIALHIALVRRTRVPVRMKGRNDRQMSRRRLGSDKEREREVFFREVDQRATRNRPVRHLFFFASLNFEAGQVRKRLRRARYPFSLPSLGPSCPLLSHTPPFLVSLTRRHGGEKNAFESEEVLG